MKKNSILVTLILAGTLTLSACDMMGKKKPTTEQLVNAVVSTMGADGQKVTDEQRKNIEEALAIQAAVAEAARKDKLDQDANVKALISLQEDQVLMQEYMRKKMEAFKPTDADLKNVYDKQVGQLSEYHFRHILVKTEEEAKAIIEKLKAGSNFAELAKQSIDPSGVKGGDLGWAPLSRWVPEFSAAGSTLKPKEFTQTPVKSQFGYHVIELVEAARTPAAVPPFEAVKTQLVEMAKQDYAKKLEDGFKPKAETKAEAKTDDKAAEKK